jgi:hypothetical protein
MSSLEQIVRPFQTQDLAPASVVMPPGQAGQALIRLSVGLSGGTKVFSYSGECNISTSMGSKHTESAPTSAALKDEMSNA